MFKQIFSFLSLVSLVGIFATVIPISTPAQAATFNPANDVVIHEPPKGWNPLTASDADLNSYNYPPRPTNPEDLKRWESVVTKGTWVRPMFGKPNNVRHVKTPVTNATCSASSNISCSYNWSGVVTYTSSSEVVGYFAQPYVC